MATKKVSYITLLKEAIKNVQEFDSNQLDVVLPQVKHVIDYDGKGEMKTNEKVDASSILERYYFKEENEVDKSEIEDDIAGETKGTIEEAEEEEEKEEGEEEGGEEEGGEEEGEEVKEAYNLFKDEEIVVNTYKAFREQEEAGTKKDKPVSKEPAEEVGEKDIVPEEEAGTLHEEDEEEEKAAEAEEEAEEAEEEAEEDEVEEQVDTEQAVVERLIAELEEGEEADKGELEDMIAGKDGSEGTLEEAEEEGEKEEEEAAGEEEEEAGEEAPEDLDVDKKLGKMAKESFPDPARKKHKEEDLDESQAIKEAQKALNFFLKDK